MDTDGQVYLGVWTNWSRGSAIMGATLTMTQSSGNILIAFTATFIPFVASRLWKMLCFVFHTYSSKRGVQHAIYHQRQVILRNSPSPDSGAFSLLVLMWTWRRLHAKALARLLPLLVFSILFMVGFTVAGGYSSQITSAMGNEVLINGKNCGVYGPPSWANIDYPTMLASNSWLSTKLADAANYVQQCYATQGTSMFDCNRFVVQNLPTETSDGNSACPFASDVCRDNATNIRLDTGYLDSNDHLGLNAPQDQRFLWRKVLSCAPLRTDGYTTSHIYENRSFTSYHYGSQVAQNQASVNYTYSVIELLSQYRQTERESAGINYRISGQLAQSFNGSLVRDEGSFVPDRTIEATDGDIVLVFLSGNGVLFPQKSNDAWYRATRRMGTLRSQNGAGSGDIYITAEAASPLGCVQQYQWCNPELTIPRGCGPLAGWLDATAGAAPLFNLTVDNSGALRIPPQVLNEKYGIYDIVQTFGARALASQTSLSAGVQLSLSERQWQVDVTNWWNMSLAFHQAAFVDTASGYIHADANLQHLVSPPPTMMSTISAKARIDDNIVRLLIDGQKIRHAGYASFSLFGLLFTYVLGAAIILMSFILDPIMRYLHKRGKYRQYQYLEWRTNGALQLHRLAQDELGYGKWSGCTDTVPKTNPEDLLSDLDISDLEYPRLNSEVVEEAKLEAGSHTETAGSDQISSIATENTIHNLYSGHASWGPRRTSDAEDTVSILEESQSPEARRVSMLSGQDRRR
ncbi:uncharacterized protein PG986_010170 [Apiospora aurea]|uniref:Uncharacterized protein n=1 Tax=Apiospora aurea TaxID=335848 RepID=A0ABR1Q9T6_9PEZI